MIDAAYLVSLKNEIYKLIELSQLLNKDKAFKKEVSHLTNGNIQYSSMNIESEHLISQDLMHLYNKCISPIAEENTVKGEFTLVYYFEKLKGKDIVNNMSLPSIQDMIKQENFKKYAHDLSSATSKENTTYIVSSILGKIKNPLLVQYVTCMYRFANFIIKQDGKITKEEELILENILNALNNKDGSVTSLSTGVDENDTLEIVLEELNILIGLGNIKDALKEFTNFLEVQKMRKEKGLKTNNNTLHAVFMGPPGTGKTTIARLLGRVFKHLGYLEKGHLVETDRAGLVAGYVGQTAEKVDKIITAALGGVLFIDEAYSLLSSGSDNDFGSEAIEILLKRMEDHRDQFIVIVAGYPDEMKEFVRSNPGLQSRFNRYYDFKHYNHGELMLIFELFTTQADFKLDKNAKDKLGEILERLYEKRHNSFGNARVVRNLFEKIIEKQANRVVSITPITKELLMTIVEEDIPPILKTVDRILMLD